MKSFQQYKEQMAQNPQESPQHPVQQSTQNPPQQIQPEKKDLNQLILLLSRKLGTKAQEYRNLLNDIKPENISKFYELIEQLGTLKQTIGAKVVDQAQQKMQQ